MSADVELMQNTQLKHCPDDEDFWGDVRSLLQPMYTHIQLANTRRGPAPIDVRNRVRKLLDLSMSYELDEHEPFTAMKESGSSQGLRRIMAEFFGCADDEIALTRNAMEGIATVLNGVTLRPGDEVVATNLCYDSNLAILRQRARREGFTVTVIELPFGSASDDDVLSIFKHAVSDRTRMITFPHVVARTGLVLPASRICASARERGIFTFIDGAHSTGHFCFRLDELGCDAFATCLHKWIMGPRGTGFLYIGRNRIADVWPLFASWSNKPAESIEKFEEVGSVFKALPAAIPEALAFNDYLGKEEKAVRLRYLRSRWMKPLQEHDRIRMLTCEDAKPGTGFGAFTVDGMRSETFAKILRQEFDIGVLAFTMEESPELKGIHLSPSLANSIDEIDRFVEAAHQVLQR